MAVTLMIENINNDLASYSSEDPDGTTSGSYFKFYQSKLRQLITQTRYRKEQEIRNARQKQANDKRLSEQRMHKEYMNYIREKSRIQTQETLTNRHDDQRKSSESIVSNSNKTVSFSIISTNISTSMESRPKSIFKSKPTLISTKQQRTISAPISSQKNLNKRKIVPTIQIDSVNETLSKANIRSFTQVSSSSSRNHHNENARRAVLNTIMLHLDSHKPSNVSQWPTYEDIDHKFSSSIAPTVYRSFERNAL